MPRAWAALTAARDLAELVRITAATYPHRPAIDGGDAGVLTYDELLVRAEGVASLLRRRGIAPGDRVAIALPRGSEVVQAILGVLLAGAAYVPLDVAYPAAHRYFITADAGVQAILASSSWVGDELPAAAPVIYLEDAQSSLGGAAMYDPGDPMPATTPRGSEPAYIIYTSGSTGAPKGVIVTHENVLSLLQSTDALFDFGPSDRWSLFHSHNFDFSVWEMWGALAYGGCVVVVPAEVSADPAQVVRLLADRRVTVLNQVPSVFQHIVRAYCAGPVQLALRYVVFGGESVRLPSISKFLRAYLGTPPVMVNMYGITEITVHATYKLIDQGTLSEPRRAPIGRPLLHLDFRVVRADGRSVAVGEDGELYIAGGGVALGYQNQPEMTAERFAVLDLGGGPRRYYRTGDIVRREDDNEYEYVGRTDAQVKIRGFRIEPGEIEAALRLHPLVVDNAVVAVDSRLGEPMLVAFVVLVSDGSICGPTLPRELQQHLRTMLPAHYIPSRITEVSSLPLTPSGKVDRAALRAR